VRPQELDHLALWVANRAAAEEELLDALNIHTIDRNGRHTLLGPSASAGKLTLFDAPESEPQPLRLVSVLLADTVQGRQPLFVTGGPMITFGMHARAQTRNVPQHALIGLTLRCSDPAVVAAEYASRFGFQSVTAHRDVAAVAVGSGVITLVREEPTAGDAPMLHHLGLLVRSAEDHLRHAEAHGIEVLDVVDAPNTLAVFVEGPEQVRLEYVEHKPEFALV